MSEERKELLNLQLLQSRAAKAHITPLSEQQWHTIESHVAPGLRSFQQVPLQARTSAQRRWAQLFVLVSIWL